MATIRKRKSSSGDESYTVQVRLKGLPHRAATFKRLSDARKWATSTEAALRERRYFAHTEAEKHTLAEAIDRYEREILPHKRPGTQYTQKRQLKWWNAKLGELPLCDLTPARIAEAKSALLTEPRRQRGKRSPATWNRYHAVLRHLLGVAEREWEWVDRNSAQSVRKLPESSGRTRWLDADERKALLEACNASSEPALKTIVTLALGTAMRLSEIRFLRWSEVNFDRRVINLPAERSKNRRARVVPLARQLCEILREHGRVRRLDTDLVFPGRETVDEIEPLNFRNAFEKAIKASNLDGVTFHTLRHTALSVAAMKGANTRELMDFGGHLSVQTSARYQHLAAEHVADIAERVMSEVL